jgi:AAA+ superfamily predicted ATPase
MKIDQITALAKYALNGKMEGVEMMVRQMIAHEKSTGREKNVQHLEAALNTTRSRPVIPLKVNGIMEVVPKKTLTDLIIPEKTRAIIMDMIEEHREIEALKNHSLLPRHKILLTGPPGNGKTSLAEAIASEMGVRFYKVDYASLIGKYLGETPSRLIKVFEFVMASPGVIFFDEFDAVGRDRGNDSDVGEMSRVVSVLLTSIDVLPAHTIVICATNHPGLLDLAAAGRFEIQLELATPTSEQAEKFIDMLGVRHNFPMAVFKQEIEREGKSYREIEHLVLNIMREAILKKVENRVVA